MKAKLFILALLFISCISLNDKTAEAGQITKVIPVSKTTWTVFGTYTKAYTSNKFPVANLAYDSGVYNNCIGHVRAQLSGGWTQITSNTYVNRGSSKTLTADTTINSGVRVSLRLKGDGTWNSAWDDFKIRFTY